MVKQNPTPSNVRTDTDAGEATGPAKASDAASGTDTGKPDADAATGHPRSPRGAVVGTGETDDVFLSKAVYKSTVHRQSLTVHHIQRRLNELGYADAYADKDGWYGDLTREAVKAFQVAERIADRDGLINEETMRALFAEDGNVRMVFDA